MSDWMDARVLSTRDFAYGHSLSVGDVVQVRRTGNMLVTDDLRTHGEEGTHYELIDKPEDGMQDKQSITDEQYEQIKNLVAQGELVKVQAIEDDLDITDGNTYEVFRGDHGRLLFRDDAGDRRRVDLNRDSLHWLSEGSQGEKTGQKLDAVTLERIKEMVRSGQPVEIRAVNHGLDITRGQTYKVIRVSPDDEAVFLDDAGDCRRITYAHFNRFVIETVMPVSAPLTWRDLEEGDLIRIGNDNPIARCSARGSVGRVDKVDAGDPRCRIRVRPCDHTESIALSDWIRGDAGDFGKLSAEPAEPAEPAITLAPGDSVRLEGLTDTQGKAVADAMMKAGAEPGSGYPYETIDDWKWILWCVHTGQVNRWLASSDELPEGATRELSYSDIFPETDEDGFTIWNGGACPVEKGTLVDVKYRNGDVNYGVSAGTHIYESEHVMGSRDGSFLSLAVDWGHTDDEGDIVAYRLSDISSDDSQSEDGERLTLRPGDYFKLSELSDGQYHAVCQVMMQDGCPEKEYPFEGGGRAHPYLQWWSETGHEGITHGCLPLDRLLTYDDVFGNPEPADDGGWIEWNGGDCPVEKGTLVDVRYRGADGWGLDGVNPHEVHRLPAGLPELGEEGLQCIAMNWDHTGRDGDIIAYRLSDVSSDDGQKDDATTSETRLRVPTFPSLADLAAKVGAEPVDHTEASVESLISTIEAHELKALEGRVELYRRFARHL